MQKILFRKTCLFFYYLGLLDVVLSFKNTSHPRDITPVGYVIKKGDPVTLTCTIFNSVPEPSVFWGIRRLDNDVSYVIGSHPVNTSSGVWTSEVNIAYFNYTDAGSYFCEAFNPIQRVSMQRYIPLSIEGMYFIQ